MGQAVQVLRDLVCGQVPGFRSQAVDLYVPEAAAAVCVYLHGGGWRVGSRRAGPGPLGPTSGRLFERMASHGLVVCSSDYRLSGEATFPAQLDDARRAIDWLRKRPEAQGLPLALFGVSAGGTIALLIAAERDLDIRAVAAWYPPTDLIALPHDLGLSGEALHDSETREALWLGAAAADDPERARSASPVHAELHSMPPLLLMHGDSDTSVPYLQSERLHAAMQAAGANSELASAKGYDHMFTGMADADVEALVDRTASFLMQTLL